MSNDSHQENSIDKRRLISIIGIVSSQLGPRAYSTVNGILLTLLVASRTSSAVAITFAITCGRLLNWFTYPIYGRISDRSTTKLGRRIPFIGIPLILMGIGVILIPYTKGYWPLVVVLIFIRQANTAQTLGGIAVVPETVGRSRWIKTIVLIVIGAVVINSIVKINVLLTWKQSDMKTWASSYEIAGIFMVIAGLLVLTLIRESKAAQQVAKSEISKKEPTILEVLKSIVKSESAYQLLGGAFIFWMGIGATVTLATVFFEKICHASAPVQTEAGIVTAVALGVIGIPVGIFLSRSLTRHTVAMVSPLLGSLIFFGQYFISNIWYSVILSAVGSPLLIAYLISIGPMLIKLFPGAGGFGERIGIVTSPFTFIAVFGGFIASIAVDTTHNYRIIWIFPAIAGLIHFIFMIFLNSKYNKTKARIPSLKERIKLYRGYLNKNKVSLLKGEVTQSDANGTFFFDNVEKWATDILESSLKPLPDNP
jgi:MFS family permease